MEQEKDNRVNARYSSVKDYIWLFLLLAAVNGNQMWIYQLFVRNGMMETNTQTVINVFILYLLATTLFITVFVALIRQRTWTQPIKKLSDAARKIADGDFSVHVVSLRKDGKKDFMEILFDDFNTMTEKLASASEKLKALSVIDELTELNNRRAFNEYINIIWKQNHRLNIPITVLMIDVDYFKKYNDSLGHLEGDKALIAVAQCMKNHVRRETDFIARFGGEEFVCLLPFITKDDAADFAKTLAANIENMKIPHPKSEHSKYLTVSIGLASIVPDDSNSQTQLLDAADKALYIAKQTGRNRVVIG